MCAAANSSKALQPHQVMRSVIQDMKMTFHNRILFAASVCGAMVMPAFAHHSFAMFDASKKVAISGTVKEFQFNNPHCFLELMAPGPNHTTVEWSIEMGAPAHVVASGWTRNTVKPGDQIKVMIHPLRSGQLGGSFIVAYGADGKKL